jgi:hypothetical protein
MHPASPIAGVEVAPAQDMSLCGHLSARLEAFPSLTLVEFRALASLGANAARRLLRDSTIPGEQYLFSSLSMPVIDLNLSCDVNVYSLEECHE